VVVEVGGGLRRYQVAGAEVVDGYARDELCDGGRGQLLLPWPNRVRDGRYRYADQELQLPVTEPAAGNAIHGLTRWSRWRPDDVSASSVTLSFDLPAQPGYPFAVSFLARYELASSGLTVRVVAHNRGRRACPIGLGAHPYVRLGGSQRIDDAHLLIPGRATLSADARGIPDGRHLPVGGTPFDFRVSRRVGTTAL